MAFFFLALNQVFESTLYQTGFLYIASFIMFYTSK